MGTKDYLALAISSIAMIASIITYILTYYQRKKEDKYAARKQLSDIVLKLIDLSIENSAINVSNNQATRSVAEKRRLLNAKRAQLIFHVKEILNGFPGIANYSDINALAVASSALGEIEDAEKYWLDCINLAPNLITKFMMTRGYANFLFQVGRHDQGRKYFKESLEIPLPDSEHTKKEKADTYITWAIVEFQNGFKDQGNACQLQAENLAQKISHPRLKKELQQLIISTFYPEKQNPPLRPVPPKLK